MIFSRESLNFLMWIERKLGMDIDFFVYLECWKYSNVFCIFYFLIIGSNFYWYKDFFIVIFIMIEIDNEFMKVLSSVG